jgi:hypothetical protein
MIFFHVVFRVHGAGLVDKEIQHGTEKLFAIDIKPHSCEAAYLIMDFEKVRNILGHTHNVNLKETAKASNIQLTRVHHRPFTHCAKATIRMKKFPKEAARTATIKGKRLIFHGLRHKNVAKNPYWLIIMDE